MAIATKNLTFLPDIDNLRKLCQSLAMLDAILSPDWENRYYSFNSKWGSDEMMASMRDGSGDEVLILFNKTGACINGFAHESIMSPWRFNPPKIWPGVIDSVPKEFAKFIETEPIPSIASL